MMAAGPSAEPVVGRGPLAQLCLVGIAILAFLSGCATRVGVVPANQSHPAAHPAMSQVALPWWYDPLDREIIRRHNLQARLRRNPDRALLELQAIVSRCPEMGEVATLADWNCRYGRKLERTQPQKALGLYLNAAALAYERIANWNTLSSTNAWNTRMVQSYNQAIVGAAMLLQRLPGGFRTNHLVSVGDRSFWIEAQSGDVFSGPGLYDQWLSADDWNQMGLSHHYRNEGLGARLIAIRTNRQATALEAHQPDEGIIHPSTAILRFGSACGDAGALKTSLVFYNPALTPQVDVGGRRWPLAADYTIPWATLLSRTRPLFKTRWTALIRPGETSRPHRLYLMEPYSPDRIPVIMVHGLRSTPLAWEQLTNELKGDPEIRRCYQIWHYLYPTGLPFLTSAAAFRDDVEEVRRMLDPEDRDFATHNIIVIGHSMGGLLARTLVTESGDALWNSTFAMPISEIDPHLEQLPELRRMFYFQPKPYIKRAIFIAVPHRGSKSADGIFGRFVSRRVRLPDELHKFIARLRTSITGLLKPEAAALFDRGYPNSIRVLSPNTPGLVALAELPITPSTPFHSIIGDRGLGGGPKSSDGVVPYWSSHLPGASSEVFVPASHRTYESPEAIAEVKRILTLHLADLAQREGSVPSGQGSESAERHSP